MPYYPYYNDIHYNDTPVTPTPKTDTFTAPTITNLQIIYTSSPTYLFYEYDMTRNSPDKVSMTVTYEQGDFEAWRYEYVNVTDSTMHVSGMIELGDSAGAIDFTAAKLLRVVCTYLQNGQTKTITQTKTIPATTFRLETYSSYLAVEEIAFNLVLILEPMDYDPNWDQYRLRVNSVTIEQYAGDTSTPIAPAETVTDFDTGVFDISSGSYYYTKSISSLFNRIPAATSARVTAIVVDLTTGTEYTVICLSDM